MPIADDFKEFKSRKEECIFDETTIELAFKILREHCGDYEKNVAALTLGTMVKPGLAEKVKQFLKDNPGLSERLREILSSQLLRMTGY